MQELDLDNLIKKYGNPTSEIINFFFKLYREMYAEIQELNTRLVVLEEAVPEEGE